MLTLMAESYNYRESDTPRMIAMLKEGRRLAEEEKQPWFMLHFDQAIVHAILHFQQDYREVLDLAVRNMLESKKPQYEGLPFGSLILNDMLSAYIGIDPLGYADAIREAMALQDSLVPPISNERYLLLGARRICALAEGDFDRAETITASSLQLADADPDRSRAAHFSVFSYNCLAEVMFNRNDMARFEDLIPIGEKFAREAEHQLEWFGFRICRAYLARTKGDEETAQKYYNEGTAGWARLTMPPDCSYRDIQTGYHLLANDVESALAVRTEELARAVDRGRFHYETLVRIKRLALLQRLNRLSEDEVAKTRAVIAKLRAPQTHLAKLEKALRGELT
jgi:hypothetical protein